MTIAADRANWWAGMTPGLQVCIIIQVRRSPSFNPVPLLLDPPNVVIATPFATPTDSFADSIPIRYRFTRKINRLDRACACGMANALYEETSFNDDVR
jgi:hypothetical protein